MMCLKIVLVIAFMLQLSKFKELQLTHQRVKSAYDEKEKQVKQYFLDKKLTYKDFDLFIRAFKREAQLEIWIKPQGANKYSLLHVYDICSSSGLPGPKRAEGDYQVPEGVYNINHFNPVSNFYLSLGLDYPNASDKILSDKKRPGGEIYIHGNCVTVGCIPLTDDKIKEVYVMALEARNNGQKLIPVHVFPVRLNSKQLEVISAEYPAHKKFWENLKVVYDDFEGNHQLQSVKVNTTGAYYF
ncbi:MAG: L,D-transpeptidase family protein [Chryseolinea sp.]